MADIILSMVLDFVVGVAIGVGVGGGVATAVSFVPPLPSLIMAAAVIAVVFRITDVAAELLPDDNIDVLVTFVAAEGCR